MVYANLFCKGQVVSNGCRTTYRLSSVYNWPQRSLELVRNCSKGVLFSTDTYSVPVDFLSMKRFVLYDWFELDRLLQKKNLLLLYFVTRAHQARHRWTSFHRLFRPTNREQSKILSEQSLSRLQLSDQNSVLREPLGNRRINSGIVNLWQMHHHCEWYIE